MVSRRLEQAPRSSGISESSCCRNCAELVPAYWSKSGSCFEHVPKKRARGDPSIFDYVMPTMAGNQIDGRKEAQKAQKLVLIL
jgi:hypothetical protein